MAFMGYQIGPPRPPALGEAGANLSMPGMRVAGFRGGAGAMRPGSPQYEAIAQMVRAQFGDLSDVPEDTPLARYLKMSGFADATPGLFPERELRQQIRRRGLQQAADATGPGGLSDFLRSSDAAASGAPSGSGGGLPPRISTAPLTAAASAPPPPRLGPPPAAPPRIAGFDTSKFEGLGGSAPKAAAVKSVVTSGDGFLREGDPLMKVFRRILNGGL